MKKIVVIVVSFIVLMSISGCSSSKAWSDKDFVFYDSNNKVVSEPTEKKYYINLEDGSEETRTYRRIKIGDNAADALKKYDLTDFTYQIRAIDILSSAEKFKTIKSFEEKAYDLEDLIPYLADIAKEDLYIWATCNIYKQDGKLCTSSKLKDDGLVEYKKLKYTIAFYIVDEKITDVYIDNHYYYWLPYITNEPKYDWVRELNK